MTTIQCDEPPDPKPGSGGTEDDMNGDHIADCNYFLWNVTNRKSLLTAEDVRAHFINFASARPQRARNGGAKRRQVDVEEMLARPVVQSYLEGSRATYEAFKEKMQTKCKCARIIKTGEVPPSPPGRQNETLGLTEKGKEELADGNGTDDDVEVIDVISSATGNVAAATETPPPRQKRCAKGPTMKEMFVNCELVLSSSSSEDLDYECGDDDDFHFEAC